MRGVDEIVIAVPGIDAIAGRKGLEGNIKDLAVDFNAADFATAACVSHNLHRTFIQNHEFLRGIDTDFKTA